MNVNDPCVTLALATPSTSDRVAIDKKSNYIAVYNPSATKIAYVKIGNSTVEAAATDTFIPPGHMLSFRKSPDCDYIAGFCTEAVTLNIQVGSGA